MITTDTTREQRVGDYRDSIASGVAFDRVAASNRSADGMNYAPMVTADQYARVVIALGRAAMMGDLYAYATQAALRSISPYLNGWQITAQVADAFAAFVRNGWHDTRAASGPEAGRPSSHEMQVGVQQAVTLMLVLIEVERELPLGQVPGVGWALRSLVEKYSLPVYANVLPGAHADLR